LTGRDALADAPKLYFTGRLAHAVRSADGLQAWIADYFGVPTRIEESVCDWITMSQESRTLLVRAVIAKARGGGALGRGAVAGERIWDAQHKFRVVLGPLKRAQFNEFLPGGAALPKLLALVRHYLGFEFEWDLRLVLQRDEVPALTLGGVSASETLGSADGRLGRTAWLNRYRRGRDADDLLLDVEWAAARRI
jgi:type VI secretion system protein ImpH